MKKRAKLLQLAKMLRCFAEISVTDADGKNHILVSETDTLEVGTEVFVEDEKGELVPANGTFETEKVIYTVEAGKITEIKEKEPEAKEEPAADEPAAEEPAAQMEEEKPAGEEEKPENTEPDEKDTEIEQLKKQIAEKDTEIEQLKQQIADKDNEIAELKKQLEEPAAEPIEDQNTLNSFTKFNRSERAQKNLERLSKAWK